MVSIPLFGQSGSNLRHVKLVNRAVVFRTIREAGEISRADLARLTGLNPATLTHITRDLLERGLIVEAGYGESKGGRRSSLLRIRSNLGFVIAVRLSRHNIQGMLTDLDMMHKVTHTLTSSSLADPIEITLPALLDLIETLLRKSGVERERVVGVGISAPGPLDARQGVLISPPNFPGWPQTPIRQIVEEKTGFRTFLDNDANSAALAEKWFGTGRELESFGYILAEDGVGGGLVFNGDIFRGMHDVAGEVGHATIDFQGPRCDCGNYGCLELYASPRAAEDHVRAAIQNGEPSLVEDMAGGRAEEISFEMIAAAAAQGDRVARQALQNIARALGAGVVNLINTFDPDAVIIGGKVCVAADLLLPAIQEVVEERILPRAQSPVPVMMSELGTEAPLIGAFSLVLRELFQNPEFQPVPSLMQDTLRSA